MLIEKKTFKDADCEVYPRALTDGIVARYPRRGCLCRFMKSKV